MRNKTAERLESEALDRLLERIDRRMKYIAAADLWVQEKLLDAQARLDKIAAGEHIDVVH